MLIFEIIIIYRDNIVSWLIKGVINETVFANIIDLHELVPVYEYWRFVPPKQSLYLSII